MICINVNARFESHHLFRLLLVAVAVSTLISFKQTLLVSTHRVNKQPTTLSRNLHDFGPSSTWLLFFVARVESQKLNDLLLRRYSITSGNDKTFWPASPSVIWQITTASPGTFLDEGPFLKLLNLVYFHIEGQSCVACYSTVPLETIHSHTN